MDRCRRCHRQLKDPASIANGFGPVCFVKHGAMLAEYGVQMELDFEKPTPRRFQGKSLSEQHAEACRIIFKRGCLD